MATSPKTGDLELGRVIAARREELGMSRKELAEATGLSYPYIAQIETGYRLPSSRHQIPIARTLGLSLDELFGNEAEHQTAQTPRGDRSRRTSIDVVVTNATTEIEKLPPSVRLEALSRIQLNVMTGVTQAQALGRNRH